MEITLAKPPMPTLPFANATEAQRAAWREEMHRWLDKHRGADLGAKGLEQEQRIIDFLSRSPSDQERIARANTERLRNRLGRNSVIRDEDGNEL